MAFAKGALRIREKALGPEHPYSATSLNDLARLLQAQGDLAAARPLYERSLAIREKALGSEHHYTAMSLNDLAVLLQAQGDRAAARPLYERALAIYEKALDPEHPDTATGLKAIREHPETATSLNNLAGLLRARGDRAAARPLYERALAIREKALRPEHPDTAQGLNNLAGLLHAQGDLAAARPLVERALAIREKALRPEHPDTAQGLNNLAFLLQAQGDLAAARPLYERALAIYEKALGPEHPDTGNCCHFRSLPPSGPSSQLPEKLPEKQGNVPLRAHKSRIWNSHRSLCVESPACRTMTTIVVLGHGPSERHARGSFPPAPPGRWRPPPAITLPEPPERKAETHLRPGPVERHHG
jgi:tetratricopeptide (TPR) repeat protein